MCGYKAGFLLGSAINPQRVMMMLMLMMVDSKANGRKFAAFISLLLLLDGFRPSVACEIVRAERRGYRYEFTFRPQVSVNVSWDVDDTRGVVRFCLDVEMTESDVLGFGFSDLGRPEDADLVLFFSDARRGHRLQDMHTNREGIMERDEQQDYRLIATVACDGLVTVEFERYFDTKDIHDYLIDTGTTHVISFVQGFHHLVREGMKLRKDETAMNMVQLLKSQLPEPDLPSDVKVLHVHVNKVGVPSEETTYWCSLHLLPSLSTKHHIVRFEGSISEETGGIVHHLEVFHCLVRDQAILPPFNGPCPSKSGRPRGLETCSKVLGAWAMGAKGISYPEEAGAPIGGPFFSRYVMIEVHYNNPRQVAGMVDSSGIKFFITEKLRRYDAGVMEIGLEYTDKMALPPRLKEWKLSGYCVPKCTEIALPRRGIKVFASQLHAHLTGRKIFTKHFRNGLELPELNRDSHYSPHFQEIRTLSRIVSVLPGDELITTCVDTTLDRTKVTLGGFAIHDEMCVNYIHYYPVTRLEVCKSSISTSSLYDIFSYFKRKYNEPIDLKKGFFYNYHVISWNGEKVRALKEFYDYEPLSVQCNKSNGDRFPGVWEPYYIPSLKNIPQQRQLI